MGMKLAGRDHRAAAIRRRIGVALGLGLLSALVASHVQLMRAGSDYTGPLALPDRVFDAGVAGGLAALAFCLGRRTVGALGLKPSNLAEEAAFSTMLGAGMLGLSVLGLGLLGLLKPLPVAGLLLVLFLISRRESRRLYALITTGVRSARATPERRALFTLFLLLLALLVLRTATPPHYGDEAIYHLSATKQFVEQGRVYPLYENPLGNMPFLLHMLYAVCLLAGSDIAAKLLSLILAVTSSLAVYGFCARFLTRRTGAVALFGFFAAMIVVEVAVTARIDVSLAGMLFLVTYAVIVYLETDRPGWLWASALLSGFSLGLKYTAGVWLLLVGVMFLTESLLRRRRPLTVAKRGVAYVVIAAAVASPWYIKNYVWFHNPVYPFVTGEVAEVGEAGVRYFTAEDERKLEAHLRAAYQEIGEAVEGQERFLSRAAAARVERHPFRFWEYFTEPEKYLVGDVYHYPNYLFLIIPALFFLKKTRWVVWLLGLSAAFYLLTVRTSWIARYLLPLYPALTVVAAYTITGLAERLAPRVPRAASLPGYAVALAFVAPVAMSLASLHLRRDLSFIAGTLSRSDYMSLNTLYYPPIDFINRKLPPDARVLMIGVQECYDLQRGYIPDTGWGATAWQRLLVKDATLEELHQDLKRQAVTHILYSPHLFGFSAMIGQQSAADPAGGAGPEYQPQLRTLATFELYRRKYLDLIYTDRYQYQVYRLK